MGETNDEKNSVVLSSSPTVPQGTDVPPSLRLRGIDLSLTDASAVNSFQDERAQRLCATTGGRAFDAAIALASCMFTQES